MRALVLKAFGQLELQDRPEPMAGPGEVKVRIGATGICGSDVHGFLGHQKRRQPGLVLGHETMGTVVDGDDALKGRRVALNPLVSCGECRACRSGRQNVCPTWRLLGMDDTPGAFAEYVVVPRRNVYPLPDQVSDAAAVMIEPLANAVHLLSMVDGVFPSAVILGAGTLGACILAAARARGVNVLLVSEPNPLRADVARRLGAREVVDPRQGDWVARARELSDGYGPDLVFDAVGRANLRVEAAEAVARGGTVLLLGMDEGPTTLDFQVIVRREVRLQTSYAYTDRDFAAALDLVSRGVVDFAPWTDVAPLADAQVAFDRLAGDPGDRLKIVLTP